MKVVGIAVFFALLAGCAPIKSANSYGPSEAYVELKPYVFGSELKIYDSPKDFLDRIKDLGGPQQNLETNSVYNIRMSRLGSSIVMSEVKDYQIDFDKETGRLGYKSNMQDAQAFGYRSGDRLSEESDKIYLSISLPEVESNKGSFVGQNAYGAKSVVDKVEVSRIYLVYPPIPKTSSRVMMVSAVSDLDISIDEFKSQRENLRLAVKFESVPNYMQFHRSFGTATVSNKRETTVNNYFLDMKIIGISIINVKTNKVYSRSFKVKFKSY